MSDILLVEDDKSLVTGLKYMLESEGYSVDYAYTKKDAIRYIDYSDYSLFILDIGLPDGSGFEVCEYIRLKNISPIIFLTARDEEEDVVRGLEKGADDFISKPFRKYEFLSRVKSVLRRYSTKNTSNILISGDVRIDQIEGKCNVREKDIYLTPTEFKLLSYFMENSKKVIDRAKALEFLWDTDDKSISNSSISVYISRLREKIELNPASPEYIITVRGAGYRWDKEVRRA